MATRTHEMKRRGLLVTLAVGALTFTGLAPAMALEGAPVVSGEPLKLAKSIARIEVPTQQKAKDDHGQTIEIIKNEVCTGVLLDEQTILTVAQCVVRSQNPYETVGANMETKKFDDKSMWINGNNKVAAPARVTFGERGLPVGKTPGEYDPDNVYWVTSAAFDSQKTQLAIARLDRPVPAKVATPVKTLNKGDGGLDTASGTFFGWRQTAGNPELVSVHTDLPQQLIVNNKNENPRSVGKQWETYIGNPESFDGQSIGDGAGMGKIEWQDVRKGFGDPSIKVATEDRGAPVLSDKGELVAIHVGAGVMLDMSQTYMTNLLKQRPAIIAPKIVADDAKDRERTAIKKLQKYVCAGWHTNPDINTMIDGMAVVQKFGSKEYINKGKRQDPDSDEIPKSKYDLPLIYDGVDFITATDPDNLTVVTPPSAPGTGATINYGTPRPQIWRSTIDPKICTDAADTAATSIAAARANLEKVYGELETRINTLTEKRDEANNDKNALAGVVGELTNYANRIAGYNDPTRAKTYDINKDYTTLLDFMKDDPATTDKDGITIRDLTSTDADARKQLVSPLCPFTEDKGKKECTTTSGTPISGKDVVAWLDDAMIMTNASLAAYEAKYKSAESLLKDAQEALDKATANKAYADAVREMAKQAAENTDAILRDAQDKYRDAVNAAGQRFIDNYIAYVTDMWSQEQNEFNAELAAKKAAKSKADAEAKVAEYEAIMRSSVEGSPEYNSAQTQRTTWQNRVNSYQQNINDANAAADNARAAMAKTESKRPVPFSDKYIPNFRSTQRSINKALEIMPARLLLEQNLALNMQAIKDGMNDYNLVDPTQINNAINQIQGYYNAASATSSQIALNGIAVADKTSKVKKSYETAPAALKKPLKLIRDNLVSQNNKTEGASTSAIQAEKALEKLLEKARAATSTAEANKYLHEAAAAVEQIERAKKTSDEAVAEANDLWDQFEAVKEGKEDPLNPNGNSGTSGKDKDKAKSDADKKKEEAAKKKAEAEAKKKAEAEAKKKAAQEKKDMARLKKALSREALRAGGKDRVLTSIAAWKAGNFPGDTVIIADGNKAADGLSATSLAGALQAPVLLTTWKTGLEPALVDQIKNSGKKHVILVGGRVNVAPYDEFEINEAGIDITRIAGVDRYDTAVKVNRAAADRLNLKPNQPLQVFIGDGVNFPDALAAGAAAGRQRGLMLLSPNGSLTPGTVQYLTELGSTRPLTLTAVGGPASRALANTRMPSTMSVNIQNIVGTDRYDTASQVAASLPATAAAVLTTGEKFPDAIPGGALAVDQNAALVLTRGQKLPDYTYQAIRRNGSERTIIVGGEKAISPKIADEIYGAKMQNLVTHEGTLADKAAAQKAREAREAEQRRAALEALQNEMGRRAANSTAEEFEAWLKDNFSFLSPEEITRLVKEAQEAKKADAEEGKNN